MAPSRPTASECAFLQGPPLKYLRGQSDIGDVQSCSGSSQTQHSGHPLVLPKLSESCNFSPDLDGIQPIPSYVSELTSTSCIIQGRCDAHPQCLEGKGDAGHLHPFHRIPSHGTLPWVCCLLPHWSPPSSAAPAIACPGKSSTVLSTVAVF